MKKSTDEYVLQHVRDGGKALRALAILAFVFVIILFAYLGPKTSSQWGLEFPLVFAGLATLAYAAFRGETLAVTIPLIIFALQFVISTIGLISANAKNEPPSSVCFGWVVGLVLIGALLRGRSALIESKKRNLWASEFGAYRRPIVSTAIGGIALVAGFGLLYYNMFSLMERNRSIARLGDDIHRMVQIQEKDFLARLEAASKAGDAADWNAVAIAARQLESSSIALEQRANPGSPIQKAIAMYTQAAGKWAVAIESVIANKAFDETARASLNQGDELRRKALLEFDRIFSKPKPVK